MDRDTGFKKAAPGKADQLALTDAQVFTTLGDGMLQTGGQGSNEGLQVGELERRPQLLVRVLVEGVQVHSKRSGEQNRVLRDDGQL